MAKLVEKFEKTRRASAQKSKDDKTAKGLICTLESKKISQPRNTGSEVSDSVPDSDSSDSDFAQVPKVPKPPTAPNPRRQSAESAPEEDSGKEKASIVAQRKWGSIGSVVPPRLGEPIRKIGDAIRDGTDFLRDSFDLRKGATLGASDAKYLAFKADLTENSRMQFLMQEFEHTIVKVNLPTQHSLKELVHSIMEKMASSAWEKMQDSTQAAEKAKAAQNEAVEVSRRAKEMQTSYLREVTSLRDQLDSKRKVDFGVTPIATWEPLDDLDTQSRDLVLSCLEEKFKECLACSVRDVISQKEQEVEELLGQARSECDQVHEQLRSMELRFVKAQTELDELRHGNVSPRKRPAVPKQSHPAPSIPAASDFLLSGFMCVGSAIHSAVQSRVGSRMCSVVSSRRNSLERPVDEARRSSESRRGSVDLRRSSITSLTSIDLSPVSTFVVRESLRGRTSYRSGDSDSRAHSLDSVPEGEYRSSCKSSDQLSPYHSECESPRARKSHNVETTASLFPADLFGAIPEHGKKAKDTPSIGACQEAFLTSKDDPVSPRRFVPRRQNLQRESVALECSEFTLEDGPPQDVRQTNMSSIQNALRLAQYAKKAKGIMSSGQAGIGWRKASTVQSLGDEESKRILLGVGPALEREVTGRMQGVVRKQQSRELQKQHSRELQKQHSRELQNRRGRESPRAAALSRMCDRSLFSATPGDSSPTRELSCQTPTGMKLARSPTFALPCVTSGALSPFDDFPLSPKARTGKHSPWEELPTPKGRKNSPWEELPSPKARPISTDPQKGFFLSMPMPQSPSKNR